MKKCGMVLAAVMTAFAVTACGSGGGIVINGTTAAQEGEAPAEGDGDSQGVESNEAMVETGAPGSAGGTRIEIVTGETQPSPVQSMEGQTSLDSAAPTMAPTTAAPAPTQAPQTTAAPAATAATETTAAKTYTVTDVSKTMYATSSVRVRQSYSTSSDVLGALAEGESVQITGESANGWMRVSWKGHEGYVSKSYLSDTAPANQPASNQTTTNQAAANPGGTTPGGTTSNGPTGPGSTSGNTAAGPGSTQPSNSNSAVGPGGSTGGTTGPGSSTPSGGDVSGGSSGTLTGSVVSLDPSGITVRTSDGGSRQFSWGNVSIPALAPGEQVQIQYSGSTVTQITK